MYELERAWVGGLEQPHAAAEHLRRHVDVQLFEQPGVERLLGDASAAADLDVPVAGRFACLPDRFLDPIHERERRRSEDKRLAGVMRHDVDRSVEGRVVAPPAVRLRIVLPRARAAAEHAPTHDERTGAVLRLADELGVGVRLSALEPMLLPPALEADDPVV